MTLVESSLFILGIILFFGLLVPEIFKKIHLPFATSLIILGSVIGPNGFNYLQPNDTLELFGFLGAAFILLLTGINSKSRHFKALGKSVLIVSFINGIIPFIVGFSIVWYFGYSLITALMVGIIMISSSTSLVDSTIKMLNLKNLKFGKLSISSVVIQDILTLLLLTLVIRDINARFPMVIYLGILISSVLILRLFLPEVVLYLFSKVDKKDDNELKLRTVIALLLITIFIFSGMGVNPIVAAFLVGIAIADIIKSKTLINKLHTIGYALFVPIFFFIVGMNMDLRILITWDFKNIFLIVFVMSLILAKFLSGFLSLKLLKFSSKESLLFGSLSISRLTTTLSSVYILQALDLLDTTIITALIFLTILSTLISPILSYIISKKVKGEIVD